MTAELRKLLALPTPRWTLVATLAAVGVAALVAALAGPGKGADMAPIQIGVGLATNVGAIVLGAWMMGVEYGQKTIRRALSADPSRARLLTAKLAVVLGTVTIVTLVVSAVSAPVFSAIADAHGTSMPIGDSLQYGVAALLNNLIYATVAFTLALLTRSMAGGMALALVFAFVIDNALGAIPTVGDYALSAGIIDLMKAVSGSNLGDVNGADPDVLRAIAVTVVWMGALLGASITRFTRTDVE